MSVEITMLPISAGDATLLRASDGHRQYSVLIDAGMRTNEAIAYLQSIGVFHLDLVILSHPDLDHLRGLLPIMGSKLMSVDRIWCFDLSFLREFIQTGTIPKPRLGTHEVMYFYQMASTFDSFADILKMANGTNVQVLQVSEGYKVCFGPMLFEVLYPPQCFYNALSSPIALKELLEKRKLPDEWNDDSRLERGEGERAKLLYFNDNNERLLDSIDIPDSFLGENFLSEIPQTKDDIIDVELPEEVIPWKLVGTLYNNMSIVVKVTILGGIESPTVLFPGDLSDWTILLSRQWDQIQADVFKLPHHGSKLVRCDKWLLRNELMRCRYLSDFFKETPFPCNCRFRRQYPLMSRNHLLSLLRTHSNIDLIRELVNPSQVMVFPLPQHNLPSISFKRAWPNILANRENRNLLTLNKANNKPRAASLILGMERHDIQEIKE
jgi:metallo-beta-lactamase superfamily protein